MPGSRHTSFAALLDHLAGRKDPRVARHLEGCAACADEAERARKLLDAGRRACAAPRLSRRALRRAVRIFREARRAPRTPGLRLVLDSWLQPAFAVRATAATRPPRFLRFEGELEVELQVETGSGRVRLRGQIAPPGAVEEVVLIQGRRRRRAPVDAHGVFELAGLSRGQAELRLGSLRLPGLEL